MITFRDVMLVQMWCRRTCGAWLHWGKQWCIVTLGEARHDCFSQCHAAADVVQGHMWVQVGVEK